MLCFNKKSLEIVKNKVKISIRNKNVLLNARGTIKAKRFLENSPPWWAHNPEVQPFALFSSKKIIWFTYQYTVYSISCFQCSHNWQISRFYLNNFDCILLRENRCAFWAWTRNICLPKNMIKKKELTSITAKLLYKMNKWYKLNQPAIGSFNAIKQNKILTIWSELQTRSI